MNIFNIFNSIKNFAFKNYILDMSLNICKTYCYKKTIFSGNKNLFTRRKESEFAYRDLQAVID